MDLKNKGFGEYFELDKGHLRVWIEQDNSVHIRAITKEGDPVELGSQELEKLIAILSEFLKQLSK